jgi:oligopeptide/dipeptide ABC transporter ATP-binding protein
MAEPVTDPGSKPPPSLKLFVFGAHLPAYLSTPGAHTYTPVLTAAHSISLRFKAFSCSDIRSHDLGVIAEVTKRVAVMYASKVAEYSNSEEIFYNPKHPYTLGLLNSIPKLNKGTGRLATIEGNVPPATNYPTGCHFCTRCPYVDTKLYTKDSKCWNIEPPLEQVDKTGSMHLVACHYWKEIEKKREKEAPASVA